VWSFFTRRLRPDWLWVETIDGPVLNFRRGKSFVSINLESQRAHLLEVAVDHYYGKLGRCGTPSRLRWFTGLARDWQAILGSNPTAVSHTHARDATATLKSGRTLRGEGADDRRDPGRDPRLPLPLPADVRHGVIAT
jgi:hypothetical protein